MNETEAKLIQKSKDGDVSAFEELITEYKKIAYNIALRILKNKEDAEDISQEALIKVFRSINQFNMMSSFKTWLYRIVVNTCLDFKRTQKALVISVDQPIQSGHNEFFVDIQDDRPSPEEIAQSKQTQKVIVDTIDKLEEDFRNVIILRDINGFSYEEISEILSCNIGTVKSRISRGRQRLKEMLETKIEDYN
ncbi:MAG: sigma-70 family RNA polymerase sigma factor [Tissierellales bacterium]|nr:sigma-70 family RNA polymerase sigma factor [Tissierellales bacterium]MBN2828132.1 sigma-70 family RNA polymerase sigma factor [Tissierellales bacterium]